MIRQVVVAMPDPAKRRRLAALVATLPDFAVCAETASLMETYSEVEERSACIVLVASSFVVLPEYEVMQGLFSTLDIRWLTVMEDASHDVGPPPGQPHGADLFAVAPGVDAETLGAKLRCITRSASRDRDVAPAMNAVPAAVARAQVPDRLILIGASTGGIDALLAVLSTFDAACPAMVVVQHTGHGFGESLAALLDRNAAPRVRPAFDGARLDVGTVHVCAGGGRQVCLETGPRLTLRFGPAEPVSGHCPSVDCLFRSAVPVAGKVSAAILTGMGRDGAEGLDALRRHGAWTVAQDAATSVVFGMPRAAAEIGAASAVLPIDKIGPALLAGKADLAPPTRLTP